MKTVIIVNIDEQLYKDITYAELRLTDKYEMSHTIMGVELKPLPPEEKLEVYYARNGNELRAYNFGLGIGWNACLKEILGETE